MTKKKNRTGYLTSPTNTNAAANHLSYLFQVSRRERYELLMKRFS